MTTRLASWMGVVGAFLLAAVGGTASEPDTTKADEKILQDAKMGIDGPALLDFFKKRTPSEVDRGRILDLIKKLGADDFEVRERATNELTALGAAAAALLRQAAQSSNDIEVIRRCERCLEMIDREARLGLAAAAAR